MENPIRFDEVQSFLGLTNVAPRMADSWFLSQAALNRPERSDFLNLPVLLDAARSLEMPDSFLQAVRSAVREVRREPRLFRYLWHCRWLLSDPAAEWPVQEAGFPSIAANVSDAAGMGYALVFLDLFPLAWERFRRRGCEEGVIRDTLGDFRRWVDHFREHHGGQWGLSNLGWLQHHLRARLFALGRLQFRMETFPYDFHAWRERSTGRVLLLAGEGMRFRTDGQFADADGQTAAESDTWSAWHREDKRQVEGFPIHPLGHALRQKVRLKIGEWIRVLKRGDAVWGVHIPAGRPMDFSECGLSLGRSIFYLPRIAPEHPGCVWTCSSWLLDPQFEQQLPSDSNTVLFLREFYLHPLPAATDHALFERVFDNRRPPFDPLPKSLTTMQRAVLEHLRGGGRWRAGGGVMFWEDQPWGRQIYRRQWA